MKQVDVSSVTGKKWLMIFLMIIVLVIYDSISTQTSIVSRAVAVGIAIDVGEEEDTIALSAQVILPRNGGQSQGGNDFAIFSEEGKTISDCIRAMNTSIGAKASFAHTTVLIVSRALLEADRIDILRDLMAGNVVSDNVQLVCADESAKDILSSAVSINEVSSYHLQRLLQSGHSHSSVNPTSLKTFFMHYTQIGQGAYMPVVIRQETDKPQDNSGSSQSDDPVYLLDVSHTLVFHDPQHMLRLESHMSRGLSYVQFKLDDGVILYEDDNGQTASARLVRSWCDRKFDYDRNTIVLNITLVVRDTHNTQIEGGDIDIELTTEERERIRARVNSEIMECYQAGLEQNIDVFFLGETAYAALGKKWTEKDNPNYLQTLGLEVNVRLKSE